MFHRINKRTFKVVKKIDPEMMKSKFNSNSIDAFLEADT